MRSIVEDLLTTLEEARDQRLRKVAPNLTVVGSSRFDDIQKPAVRVTFDECREVPG